MTKFKKPVRRTAVLAVLAVLCASHMAHAANWWETIKVKGDFRYRHEMIDQEGKDNRSRQRIRARIGLTGKVSDYTTVGVQLATGSSDPVSTNQTLGNGFSTKSIGLDLAYFKATHPDLPGFTLTGGKMKNPIHKAGGFELIWDGDLNPEGGALGWSRDVDNVTLNLLGGGFWITERSSGDDSWLGAGQGMATFNFNEKKSAVTVGGGYYNFVNAKGFMPFYDAGDAFGNTVMNQVSGNDTTEVYANDYELFEVFGEVSHKFNEIPVSVAGDFVTNTAADSLETAWLVGLKIGKTGQPGTWSLRYNYREVKADAVVGVFTDSDFRGGGTNAKGHELGGNLQLAEHTTLAASYFINKLGLEAANEIDFNRLQLDVQFKF